MTRAAPLVYTPIFENIRSLGAILAPKGLHWITELPEDMRQSGGYLLHLSCMAHYTPHIPYIAQRILERVRIECPILGGPESCCGTLHVHFGDQQLGRHAARAGIAGFKRARPATVVSICPDCDESFNGFMPEKRPFDVVNISELLVRMLPALRDQLTRLDVRVVIHKHTCNDVRVKDMTNMEQLLRAIPGLEVVPSNLAFGPGRHCNVLEPMARADQEAMLRGAEAVGADLIVVPYHSCYRQHCMLEINSKVKIEHYLGLLAMSLHIEFEERYKELRLLDDIDKAVERLRTEAAERGISVQALRQFLQTAIYCY